MSYDNAKACPVVETTADASQNMINVDQSAKPHAEIQPENVFNFEGKRNTCLHNFLLMIKAFKGP